MKHCPLRRAGMLSLAWLSVAFLALAAASAAPAAAVAPTPVISVVGHAAPNPADVSGMAPFAVHVNGLATTPGEGTLRTADFVWDFGDDPADGGATGSRFNRLDGWGGAHIYDDPGTYQLSLTVSSETGEEASVSISVEVTPDTRTPVYVSNAGDDAFDGSTPALAVRTISRVQQLLGHRTAILLRRGDTFDTVAQQIEIDGFDDVLVGAYGSGAAPRLMGSSLSSESNPAHVAVIRGRRTVVQDVEFTAPVEPTQAAPDLFTGVGAIGEDDIENLTVRRCQFDNVGFSITVGGTGGPAPRAALILDNETQLVGRYLLFAGASDLTVLGNHSRGTHDGHSLRFYADRVWIAHNRLETDTAHIHLAGTALSLAGGEHAYVAHNELYHWVFVGFLTQFGTTPYTDAVFDGNVFRRAVGLDLPTLRLFASSERLVLRNNVFDGAQTAIRLDNEEGAVGDVDILHNTALSPADDHGFLDVLGAPLAGAAIRVAGNLVVQPNFAGGAIDGWDPYLITSDVGLGQNFTFSHNLWQLPLSGDPFRIAGTPISMASWIGDSSTSGEGFGALDLDDLGADFRPLPGTAPLGHAAPVAGAAYDFHREARPTGGPWTAGAAQGTSGSIFADDFESGDLSAWN